MAGRLTLSDVCCYLREAHDITLIEFCAVLLKLDPKGKYPTGSIARIERGHADYTRNTKHRKIPTAAWYKVMKKLADSDKNVLYKGVNFDQLVIEELSTRPAVGNYLSIIRYVHATLNPHMRASANICKIKTLPEYSVKEMRAILHRVNVRKDINFMDLSARSRVSYDQFRAMVGNSSHYTVSVVAAIEHNLEDNELQRFYALVLGKFAYSDTIQKYEEIFKLVGMPVKKTCLSALNVDSVL